MLFAQDAIGNSTEARVDVIVSNVDERIRIEEPSSDGLTLMSLEVSEESESETAVFSLNVQEGLAIGTIVAVLDVTPFGTHAPTYTLTTLGTPFTVDPATGSLLLSESLDYTSSSFHELEILVEDSTGHVSYATIHVFIMYDESLHLPDEAVQNPVGNAPHFDQASFVFVVPFGAPAGTVVGQVSVYDLDGDTIHLSIVHPTGGVPFRVDSDGSITATGPVTFDESSTYQFFLQAMDPTGNQTMAFVEVSEELPSSPFL